MMQCQYCGDTNGPWEYAEVLKNRRPYTMLVCEDCANYFRKLERKLKKDETANLLHKRYAR